MSSSFEHFYTCIWILSLYISTEAHQDIYSIKPDKTKKNCLKIYNFMYIRCRYSGMTISSAESQKGINAIEWCSVENQNGAVATLCTVIAPFWLSTDNRCMYIVYIKFDYD